MNNLLVLFNKYKKDILIVTIFIILPFIFFRSGFKLNSVILGSGDPTSYYFPLHYLKIELVKNLEFPFWNRYNFSGFPLLANPQVNIFFFLTLVLGLIFPVVISYNLSMVLSYSLAGIFFYLFLREYKLSRIASFTGGLIFIFSGPMITHRSHATNIYGMIWVILILLLLEKYRKYKKFEYILFASIFYSISFFSSQPQIFLYSSLIILVFIIYYSFIYNGGKNYYFLLSGLVFLIGFLLMSVQFFQTYELMNYSVLKKIDYGYFSSFSFNPKLLILTFFPYIFGNPFYQFQDVPTYFGPWNYTEMVIYFGITTIPLIIFGFFVKNKHKYLWIFLMVFSFFLVLGGHTPLYKLMYYIPLFNMFRVPARNWFEFGFAFSVMAGFGFDYFIKLNKTRIKKIVTGLIIFFSAVITGFFVFYYLLKTGLKDNLIKLLGLSGDKAVNLLQSIKFSNYSIFIPLIIIFLNIFMLVSFLFKKNRFLYMLLIILIALDLFCFGYFYEADSDITYLEKKIGELPELEFLEEQDSLFRVYPVSSRVSDIILCNNKNIHHKIDVITGYDTLLLKDYNYITGINNSSDYVTNLEEFLKNNKILSMLNTKYIIIKAPDDMNKFKNSITRFYWSQAEPVLDNDYYSRAEFNDCYISDDESEIIIGGEEEKLKFFKAGIDIEDDKDYMINFKIRKNENVDNFIRFDFYGNGYDESDNEFCLSPDSIREDYMEIEKVVNSGDIPSGSDVYFRIFTSSAGKFSIKDLEIHEAIGYYDYKTVYNDGSNIILENKNFIPRFYFVNEVIEVDNLEDVKEVLWEGNVSWEYEKIDLKTTAFVEDIGFDSKKFNTKDNNVDVISYKNNEVRVKTRSECDSFMVFSDTYYPGWRAYIDDSEARIYRTNGILKGIYIPEGEHTVIFKYTPSYFWIGATISSLTFILVTGAIIVLFCKRKKKDKV